MIAFLFYKRKKLSYDSLSKMTKPTAVDKTTVVMISNMKFQPMTPKIRKAPIFGNVSPTPLSKNGLKKMRQNTPNIVVLITGTKKLDSNKPKRLCFFLSALNTRPAIIPATVHLSKHARIVPAGLIGMKMANVDGENRAIMPLKKPTIAPESGPHIAAANTIVIIDKLILTGPNCK